MRVRYPPIFEDITFNFWREALWANFWERNNNNGSSYTDQSYLECGCETCLDNILCSNFNNNSNVVRRRRGRQTTFHKVGGHPCLRLDLSSLESDQDDDEVIDSVSPPLLRTRTPIRSIRTPSPAFSLNSQSMGTGASNVRSTSVANTSNRAKTVERTDAEQKLTGNSMTNECNDTGVPNPESARPLMPAKNELIISGSGRLSGGSIKVLKNGESSNNNAASSSSKKKENKGKSPSKSEPEKKVKVKDVCSTSNSESGSLKLDLTNLKSVDCTCIPPQDRRKASKPPSCDPYIILQSSFIDDGREIDYVEGDGNCFFRALSKEVFGSEDSHFQLRQTIVNFMSQHRSNFEQFVDTDIQSFQAHLGEMRQYSVWATTAEIYATSTLLQRNIYIFSPDHTGLKYSWLLFTPCFPRESEYNSCPRCYITLCHTNGNHYDRVASLDGWCNCSQPPPGLSGESDVVSVASQSSNASLYCLKPGTDNRSDRTTTPGE